MDNNYNFRLKRHGKWDFPQAYVNGDCLNRFFALKNWSVSENSEYRDQVGA